MTVSATIKQGDIVVIPAGTEVKSMHPSRKRFITKRKMMVTVHHTLPAYSISIMHYIGTEGHRRSEYPAHMEEFAKYDELLLDSRTNPDEKVAHAMYMQAYKMRIKTSKAKVCWPGAGGYWNDVDMDSATLI